MYRFNLVFWITIFFYTSAFSQTDFSTKEFYSFIPSKVQHAELINGLDVIVYPDTSTSLIHIGLSIKGGRSTNQKPYIGAYKFFELLLYSAISDSLNELKKLNNHYPLNFRLNKQTQLNYTLVQITTYKEFFYPCMKTLYGVVHTLRMDTSSFLKFYPQIESEIKESRVQDQSYIIDQEIKPLLLDSEASKFQSFIRYTDFRNLNVSLINEFIDQQLQPSNASLFVIGNMEMDTIVDYIDQEWGIWYDAEVERVDIDSEESNNRKGPRFIHYLNELNRVPMGVLMWSIPTNKLDGSDHFMYFFLEEYLNQYSHLLFDSLIKSKTIYKIKALYEPSFPKSLFSIYIFPGLIEVGEGIEATLQKMKSIHERKELITESNIYSVIDHMNKLWTTKFDQPSLLSLHLAQLCEIKILNLLINDPITFYKIDPDHVLETIYSLFNNREYILGILSSSSQADYSGLEEFISNSTVFDSLSRIKEFKIEKTVVDTVGEVVMKEENKPEFPQSIELLFDAQNPKITADIKDKMKVFSIYILEHPNDSILIQGYTLNRENSSYIEQLSQAWADYAKNIFVKHFNVHTENIVSKGEGNEHLSFSIQTAKMNRKIIISIKERDHIDE